MIVGIDEAGRGPVIGPMVIAGVKGRMEDFEGIGFDSKSISARKREELFDKIKKAAIDYVILKIDADELNRLMERKNLNVIEMEKFGKIIDALKPEVAYIDAPEADTEKFKRKLAEFYNHKCKIIAENKADEKYPIVGAASILAKVVRDREMEKISEELGIDLGSGYPGDERTAEKIEKLIRDGKNKYIRERWATVRAAREKIEQRRLDEW